MIYITGDIHADPDSRFDTQKFNADDFLIICGDFGFIWESDPFLFEYERTRLERFLNFVGCTILFVQGNHENFDRLKFLPRKEMFGGVVGEVTNRCYHLLQGEVYNIEGYKILTLGGAESVDRKYRLPHLSWWEEERISLKDTRKAVKMVNENDIDIIITHCCPLNIKAELFKAAGFTPFPEEDKSGKMLDKLQRAILEKGKPFKWYFGHFHFDQNLGNYVCKYTSVEGLPKR